MSTTPRLAQTFSFAILLVAAAFVPAAMAEQAAKNTEHASSIGPAVPLSAEQMLAIQAKRAADPGTRMMPTSAGRVVKLAGVPPSATARVSRDAAAVPGKPYPTPDLTNAPTSLRSWRSYAARLGPIPRPEWGALGMPAKPADITVSRPRNSADATSRAAAPGQPGGER